MKKLILLSGLYLLAAAPLCAQMVQEVLKPIDVFALEYVSDPQIAPDGSAIVYVRNFKDIMKDKNRSNLWITDAAGKKNEPLTSGMQRDYSPRWSPDGKKLAYLSGKEGSTQIYLRWLSSSAETRLTNLERAPGNIQWSPDGKWLSFTMAVPHPLNNEVQPEGKPAGAEWTTPPVVIDRLQYRYDGAGFLESSFTQLFIMSADGGYPVQLTNGMYNHNGQYSWTPDSKALVFSANRHEDREYEPANTEVYQLDIATHKVTALSSRKGPDNNATVSPDGKWIAYTGYDEKYLGYQIDALYLMDRQKGTVKTLGSQLDRNIENIQWSADSKAIFFQYNTEGNTRLARMDLNGTHTDLTKDVGGLSIGRPYSGGDFSVSKSGLLAFTHSTPDHPADLAIVNQKGEVKRLTEVNADLFAHKKTGTVEEIWYTSSYDGQKIQGWICKPPNFDPTKKYPLILEIHGGPFANYGDRFSMEVQLYAAAGYVVLYTNPRGSSSYGKDFGNLIHHNYPNQDYDDLMSGVDALLEKGYVAEDKMYVTGGSGGGVLTAWIVGKTNRFRAAVVAKPVINWYSFVLHADNPAFFYKYWFPGYPWEHQEHYMKRSPISLVGNVKTPTMLLTGEQDYRTPMSETEQYYAALKLQKIPTAMVRIQNSGHGIAAIPSNLMHKVNYILDWFAKYE